MKLLREMGEAQAQIQANKEKDKSTEESKEIAQENINGAPTNE